MMIATFILSVSILALTSVTITAMRVNLENDLRNTAVRLTKETVEEFLTQPIDGITTGNRSRNVNIRGGTKTFTVTWTVLPLTNDLREIRIQVGYDFRGRNLSNNSVIYKHRAI